VPAGGREVHTANGGRAVVDKGGHPVRVQAHGMDIHHGPGNQRTIVRERPGGVRVVSDHYGHGYIAHPYRYGGRDYYRRSYYYNGRMYSRFYQPYLWGGVPLSVYAPQFYFGAAYYGWAYNPWVTPIAFGWGWAGNPWYGYYGAWYTPYPAYAGPAFWLTDYLVSQTLMAAYQERAAELANQQVDGPPLTDDVKNAIAAEVKLQLARENAEATAGGLQAAPDPAASSVARLLSDNKPHVFVVSSGLSVNSTGGACFVTEGDVLQLMGTVAPGQPASLTVMASKGQDCGKGTAVQVEVADLQEMQNHMRETLDQGLADLQKKQGTGGIPAAPSSAMAAPQQTAYATNAPAPDPNVQSELSAQTKEAEQAEQEVLADPAMTGGPSAGGDVAGKPGAPAAAPGAAAAVPAPAAPTVVIKLGMSINDVVALKGQPKTMVGDPAAKLIYIYDGMKLIFNNGKLTDMQ
jgi:hypothetical protein